MDRFRGCRNPLNGSSWISQAVRAICNNIDRRSRLSAVSGPCQIRNKLRSATIYVAVLYADTIMWISRLQYRFPAGIQKYTIALHYLLLHTLLCHYKIYYCENNLLIWNLARQIRSKWRWLTILSQKVKVLLKLCRHYIWHFNWDVRKFLIN